MFYIGNRLWSISFDLICSVAERGHKIGESLVDLTLVKSGNTLRVQSSVGVDAESDERLTEITYC